MSEVGDLYQITSADPDRQGLIGAIVLATEIKPWGIQGFVHHLGEFRKSSRIYLRLKWEDIEHVGHAHLIPADEVPET